MSKNKEKCSGTTNSKKGKYAIYRPVVLKSIISKVMENPIEIQHMYLAHFNSINDGFTFILSEKLFFDRTTDALKVQIRLLSTGLSSEKSSELINNQVIIDNPHSIELTRKIGDFST